MAIPTKLPITFSCDHAETKDLSDTPVGDPKCRAYGLGKNFVCSKCFTKQGQQNQHQLNKVTLADAMGFEKDHDLSELEGSEQQVTWATRPNTRFRSYAQLRRHTMQKSKDLARL